MIAIVTDIHAHLFGLQACLERIEELERTLHKGRRSLRVCLGDVLDAGPLPLQTLNLLLSEFDVFLRGNHEDYVFGHLADPKEQKYLDPLWKMVPWAVQKLSSERVLDFKQICLSHWATADGLVKFFHASPQSNSASPPFFPMDWQEERVILKSPKSLVAVGHTHYFGVHCTDTSGLKNHWINAGSVGYPFLKENPKNSYSSFVTLHFDDGYEVRSQSNSTSDVEVRFHKIPYSRHSYLQACLETGFLEECYPFSIAIVCQSSFNEDITFPFFKKAKNLKILQQNLPHFLMKELQSLGYLRRLKNCLGSQCPSYLTHFEH